MVSRLFPLLRGLVLLVPLVPLAAAAQIAAGLQFKGVLFVVDKSLIEQHLVPVPAPATKDGPLFTATDHAALYETLRNQTASPRKGVVMTLLPELKTSSGQAGIATKDDFSVRIEPILGKDGETLTGHVLLKSGDRSHRGRLGSKVGETGCIGAFAHPDPAKLEVLFLKADFVK